jgi:hypothetical protein
MKFNKLGDFGAVNGTSLQGYVTATYSQLEKLLGKPTYGPNANIDGKVTCEWVLHFDDGTVVTVYDWKTYSKTPKGPYSWHIGGANERAVALAQGILNADHCVEH